MQIFKAILGSKVAIAVAPKRDRVQGGIIIPPGPGNVRTRGIVMQTGPQATDVLPGYRVEFAPIAAVNVTESLDLPTEFNSKYPGWEVFIVLESAILYYENTKTNL